MTFSKKHDKKLVMDKQLPTHEDFSHNDPNDPEQKSGAVEVIESLTKKARENIEQQDLTESDIESAVEDAIANTRQRQ